MLNPALAKKGDQKKKKKALIPFRSCLAGRATAGAAPESSLSPSLAKVRPCGALPSAGGAGGVALPGCCVTPASPLGPKYFT